MTLYDYIYVDLEKVISLYSQLIGGVVAVREVNTERAHSADNKRHYDFTVFKHDAGGTDQGKSGLKEVIKPHHSLLTELEDELAANGYLIDLTTEPGARSLGDPALRAELKSTLCLKVRGRAVIEDYERMKSIAQVFPKVVELINKSSESTLLQSPAYQTLQTEIRQIDREIKETKDRNDRARKEQQLIHVKKSVEDLLLATSKVGAVDQWILDGLKTWIDAFLPGIVNLRIYPSGDRTDAHVFGHLKKACLEDRDSNSFHFTYGSMPTESLTMIGIITSVPNADGESFKPLVEFEKQGLADYESVENAFRGMFRGFDGMEQLIRTCRFPRVLVHPLTVYRSVERNPAVERRR